MCHRATPWRLPASSCNFISRGPAPALSASAEPRIKMIVSESPRGNGAFSLARDEGRYRASRVLIIPRVGLWKCCCGPLCTPRRRAERARVRRSGDARILSRALHVYTPFASGEIERKGSGSLGRQFRIAIVVIASRIGS